MGAAKAYLTLYNTAQALGWTYCLYLSLNSALGCKCFTSIFEAAYPAVAACQGLALLETVHAALGLVGGSPAMAFMQWAGRSNVLFAIARAIPELWGTDAAGVLFIAWALSEVVRYPWYAASLVGACPGWLTWLRYTAFIPLYPVGVLCEMKLVWDGLPYIAARSLHSIALPNAANFAFSYGAFMKGVLVAYPFLWFQLYSFLFRQRAKKLRPAAAAPKKRD